MQRYRYTSVLEFPILVPKGLSSLLSNVLSGAQDRRIPPGYTLKSYPKPTLHKRSQQPLQIPSMSLQGLQIPPKYLRRVPESMEIEPKTNTYQICDF